MTVTVMRLEIVVRAAAGRDMIHEIVTVSVTVKIVTDTVPKAALKWTTAGKPRDQ